MLITPKVKILTEQESLHAMRSHTSWCWAPRVLRSHHSWPIIISWSTIARHLMMASMGMWIAFNDYALNTFVWSTEHWGNRHIYHATNVGCNAQNEPGWDNHNSHDHCNHCANSYDNRHGGGKWSSSPLPIPTMSMIATRHPTMSTMKGTNMRA